MTVEKKKQLFTV